MSYSSRVARFALALAVFVFAGAAAQAYPAKPIHIIVPFAAGGTSDILARFISPKLTEAWGQPVIGLILPGSFPHDQRTHYAAIPVILSTELS